MNVQLNNNNSTTKKEITICRSRFACCLAPLTFYLHREGGTLVIVKFGGYSMKILSSLIKVLICDLTKKAKHLVTKVSRTGQRIVRENFEIFLPRFFFGKARPAATTTIALR